MRVTLLTGMVVFAVSLCLTLTSIHNARSRFVSATLLTDLQPIIDTQEQEINAVDDVDMEIKKIPATLIKASKTFDGWSYIYLFVISAFGTVAVYFIVGCALKPVKDLSDVALRITGNNLKERIPERAASDEIGSLISSFNSMLDRLDQSFQQQKQFSANAAHELKTPLATINAGIQVLYLDEQPGREDCLETLEIAEKNVKRLMDVVDNLFLLSNESIEQYGDIISVKDLFADILKELSPLYEEKYFEIMCEIQMISFKGNRTLIRRAFFNLVENAMKYSSDRGKIIISAENGRISISNMGAVIPEEDLNKIFEPFYRVDQSRSRQIGGAGLGLSIVKVIAEKHGFTIKAESGADGVTKITMIISSNCCLAGTK